jgi:hypothetical protein
MRHLFIVIALFASIILPGQTDGTIRGYVRDKMTGETLPFATILAKNIQPDSIKSYAVTDVDGNFSFEKLQPGTYNLIVLATGYEKDTIRNVIVQPVKTTYINISIEPLKPCACDEVIVPRVQPAKKRHLFRKKSPFGKPGLQDDALQTIEIDKTICVIPGCSY